MAKKQKTSVPAPPARREKTPWNVFFSRQRNPILRSQLITALMSGHPLEVERLPRAVLLDAVILSTASRTYLEAEIIDDYEGLLKTADVLWKDPMYCCKVFDQYHSNLASFIITHGLSEFVCREDEYVPEYVGWLLEQEPPEYFSREVVK